MSSILNRDIDFGPKSYLAVYYIVTNIRYFNQLDAFSNYIRVFIMIFYDNAIK